MSKIELYNEDCMELMKRYPDNYFELAIIDPPYTDDYKAMQNLNKDMKGKVTKVGKYHYSSLTNAKPLSEYWNELKRVSRNQIVWGANYLIDFLSPTPCVIVWDKNNSGNFADCEIAFGSFKSGAKIFKYTWNGMLQEDMQNKETRIHPTQKPVALYKWLLTNYAKQGDKILDTHGGSMSIAIACHDLGFDLTISELDKDYFESGKKRLDNHRAQGSLFDPKELVQQTKIEQ